MSEKKITRQLSIFINGKEVKNSLGSIGREIGKVKAQLREANDPADIKKYKAELDELGKKYGDVKKEISDTNTTLADAKGHWDNMLSGFLSGNIDLAKEGLKGLSGSIKGVIKTSAAFLASPLGIAAVTIAGIVAGAKAWFDYNTEISKTIKLTEQLTGLQGEELSQLRAEIQATASTFDKDYNEVLRSTNALSKQMKISQTEALDLITQGFVRGADASGDFLKKVEEYPVQFKNAGYSAQDFIDIATQEVKGGVYDDKLVDALKEANLALQEMTQTQKDALKNAFGKTFADEIAKGLKTGEITTKQAIDNIIKKSNELGLNYQQQQQIVADLFKGAGEDAGGFAEIILQLNEAFKEENKTLNENELATERLVISNQEYEKALADLFDASSSGFPAMLTNLKSIGNEITTSILTGLKQMFTSIEQLKEQAGLEGTSNAVKDISDNIKQFGSTAEEETKYLIESTIKNIDRLKTEIDDVGFIDLFGTEDALQQQLSKKEAYLKELKLIAQGESQAFKDYQASLDAGTDDPTFNPDNGNTDQPDKEDLEAEAAKKLIEAKKKLFEKGEQELNQLIKQIQLERLADSKSGVAKELELVDQKYAKLREKFILSEDDKLLLSDEKIREREDALMLLEDEKAREKHELKKERDLEFKEELDLIEEENRIAEEELRLEREAEKAVTDEERQLRLLEKAQYVANEQLKIELKRELDSVAATENAEQLKAAIRQKYAIKQGKIDDTFSNGKKALQDQEVKWTDLTENQKLDLVKNGLNSAASLFNEQTAAYKAIKVTETLITTYQSATNAFNSLSVIPIVGPVLGGIAAAAAVVSGLANVKKIVSTKSEKMPTYYYGGPTGDKAIYHDEYGAVTGAVHEDEWVAPKMMTQDPRYASTLGWLESERQMKLGKGYFNGGSTSTPDVSFSGSDAVPDNSQMFSELITLMSRLSQILDSGIRAYTVKDMEEFQRLKEIDDEYEQILRNTTQ